MMNFLKTFFAGDKSSEKTRDMMALNAETNENPQPKKTGCGNCGCGGGGCGGNCSCQKN